MNEQKDPYKEKVKDHVEKIIGSFLPRILHLENLMKDIMSRHYCSDDEKGAFFFYSILPHMSFSEKITTFITVLKTSYNDIYKMFESDLKKLIEIDEYRRYLESLLLNGFVDLLNKEGFDNGQSIKLESGKPGGKEALNKEYENAFRMCTQIVTTLKLIQRDIIVRGYGP